MATSEPARDYTLRVSVERERLRVYRSVILLVWPLVIVACIIGVSWAISNLYTAFRTPPSSVWEPLIEPLNKWIGELLKQASMSAARF